MRELNIILNDGRTDYDVTFHLTFYEVLVCSVAVADPDLQIRGGGGEGALSHPDPEIRGGGGGYHKKIFSAPSPGSATGLNSYSMLQSTLFTLDLKKDV